MCAARGATTAANEVDHIIPHKGNQDLFWRESNWQPLCKTCHSAKTRSEQTGKPIKGTDANGYPIDPEYHEAMRGYR
jgi:5-methylcytosine-specific restriction protein A